jgi:hypothetical protein
MAEQSRELDILSGPQLGFLSLVRIIAVLIARTGGTTVEIGAAELDALPEVPALTTWRNPTSFTECVRVELPPHLVEQIQRFGVGLADERAGIVDAEIVQDEPLFPADGPNILAYLSDLMADRHAIGPVDNG